MFDTDANLKTDTQARNHPPLMTVRNLNLWYGETHALKDVNLDLYRREVLAFIGPSGCGKSTALKCLNRMHDDTRDVRIEGTILMDGIDVQGADIDPPVYRRRFGWVAQKPNPFPRTILKMSPTRRAFMECSTPSKTWPHMSNAACAAQGYGKR